MDWPAFLAASGGVLVGTTGLIALLAKLGERRRIRLEAERRAANDNDIDSLWHVVQDLADRVRDLETADKIERHDRREGPPTSKRRSSR